MLAICAPASATTAMATGLSLNSCRKSNRISSWSDSKC